MVNMIELDHRFVIVGGLIVACLFYQVPFFTIAAVIVCGCAIYVRNRYKKGDRVSLGLNGFRFVRQTRSLGRLRTPKTPPNTTRLNTSPAVTPRSQTWGNNLSLGTTPVSPCDYGTYSPYRGYHTSKMLQARLNQGSPKTPPELGSKGINGESPVYFQKQSTGSLGGKPDMSVNKPDTSYNDICQTKYVGVGVYPTVHLEPSLPLLLSNFNSTMTKSRVTVKLAPKEKASFQKSRFQSLQNISADAYTSESSKMIDELKGTRKRSMKDDVSEAIQKRQRVEEKLAAQPFLNSAARFLSNGIDHRFNSHLCDESMLILPPHFVNELDVMPKPLKSQLSKKCNIAGRDSIESSYSSSKKIAEKAQQRRKIKRKPEHDSLNMPENKISRRKMSIESLSSPNAPRDVQNLSFDDTAILTGSTTEDRKSLNVIAPDAIDDQRSHSSLVPKPQISPVLGSRSSSSMYIPSYIPTLDDYLQDKILNEQRLQKLLSAIAGKGSNEERDAATLKLTDKKEESLIESASKASESPLVTSLVVNTATVAPAFSFGKTPFIDSTAPSLAKSSNLSTESGASDVNQSKLSTFPPANLTAPTATQVLVQTLSASNYTPTSSLNVTSPSISNATTTSSFSLASSLNPPTSILPAVTSSTMVSSASAISSPFNSSIVMPTPSMVPFKPATSTLITQNLSSPPSLFSFGQIMPSSTTSSMITPTTTTAPPVPFSVSSNMNLSFGTAVPTSLNTSTVTSVTNPLFSFGSSTPKSDVPAFSAGAGPNSLRVSAPSSNPTFSMTLPTTSVSSVFNAPSSMQAAGTASTGFQFGAFGLQTPSSLNDKAMKETATSVMAQTTSMSPVEGMTSSNNVAATGTTPSLFNAVGLKPLLTNSTITTSLFQQENSSINPSSQPTPVGFAFGLTQNVSAIKNAGSMLVSPNASQGVNLFVTNQPLAFGTASISQTSNSGNSNTGTSLAVVGSNNSSTLSTGTPFSFGNATSAYVAKPSMVDQPGKNDGPLSSISASFGANNVGSGANNAGFGASNAGFGASSAGFGASSAGFGASSAGFGASSAGFGASNGGLGTNNASFGAHNAGFGANNAGFGASNAGFGASNVGFGASSAGFGASSAGFGASNASFGASNPGFGSSNTGFGASNAGLGTNNAGFGSGGDSTGFGAANINGNPPPSYSSSAGNAITTFGGNIKHPSTSGFSFGNTAAPKTPAFGNSSVVSLNSNASFQFNGPSTNHSNTNLFASSFSNNNENNNASLGSPFTIKTQTPQASNNQGFNFNPGAQPSFNFGSTATTPLTSPSSMFSVGTGNVVPRFGKASGRNRNNR